MMGTLAKRENTERKKGHKLFIALMCLFVAMFFVRNVFKIEFPIVLFLGIVAVIAVVSSREEIVALVVSFIPFSVGFQYKYAIFICIAVYLVKFAKTVKYPKYAFAIVAMFVWELFHAFGWEFSPFEALRGFSELIFLAFILMAEDFDFSDGLVMRTMAYCTVTAAAIVFLVSLNEMNYDILEFLESGIRFGEADEDILNFGFNYNQNGLGLICNVSISGLLIIISNKKAVLLDYMVIAFLIFIGLLTVSRSFIICLAVAVLLFIFFQSGSIKKKALTILIIVILILLIILVINGVMPQIFKNFETRFNAEDMTGGRNDLFAFYNKHIFSDWKHLLFGVGIQNYSEKVNGIHNTQMNACHNGYQEVMVVWGIVGMVLVAYMIYCIIRKSGIDNDKRKYINFLTLLILLLQIMSGQFINAGKELLCLVVVFACLSYGKNSSEGGMKPSKR